VNAVFSSPEVHLEGRELKVRCRIENHSSEPWSSAAGFGLGYHLFDDPTGTLVVDGARQPLDLTPAEQSAFDLKIPLPPEPGEYNIRVSAMRENVDWFYNLGWPFLMVEVTVGDDGAATITGWRITVKSRVDRKRMLRSFVRGFTLPIEAVSRHRGLVRTLVRREILSRYSGSFGGALWAILNPLLLMLTYFFVFAIVLKTPFPGDPSRSGFVLYYIGGFLPWLAFSEAVGRAPTTLVEHRNFIKKLVFPVEILPFNLTVAGLVTEGFGIGIFAIALLLLRHHLPATALYLPLLLVPQILFTAGLCWFLSALGVFFRDLAQINGFLITIWFFITPICYPETGWTAMPRSVASILSKNPIYILVRGYRAIFLESRHPEWVPLAWLTLASAVIFLLGHAWFYKLRKSFADII
jgi:lipopolysaccharide transport system permease protein